MAVTLGKVNLAENVGRRDAVHVQVILVVSSSALPPSAKVRFTDDTLTSVRPCEWNESPHAIIDPFSTGANFGEKVNVLIMPGLTTDPVHHFEVRISDFSDNPSGKEMERIDELESEVRRLNRLLREKEEEYEYSDGCGPGCG